MAQNISVIIYGSGKQGMDLYKSLSLFRKDISITAFCNSFTPGRLFNRPVITPSELPSFSFDQILIASAFSHEILEGIPPQYLSKTVVADFEMIKRLNIKRGEGPFADIISIDLIRNCDMNCRFCFAPFSGFSGDRMPLSVLHRIIDQIQENVISKNIHFLGDGEPLLYSELEKAIQYATARGLSCHLTTNAKRLTPKKFEGLCEAGLSNIMISMHNLSQEGFSHRFESLKCNYDEYRDQIIECIKIKVDKSLKCNMILTLMVAYPNWPAVKMFDVQGIVNDAINFEKRFLRFIDLVLKKVSFQTDVLTIVKNELAHFIENSDGEKKFDYSYLELCKGLSIMLDPMEPLDLYMTKKYVPEFLDYYEFEKDLSSKCPGFSPMIWVDGTVTPCCFAHRASLPHMYLGNINNDCTLLEIFGSKKYSAIFDAIQGGRLPFEDCSICLGKYHAKY